MAKDIGLTEEMFEEFFGVSKEEFMDKKTIEEFLDLLISHIGGVEIEEMEKAFNSPESEENYIKAFRNHALKLLKADPSLLHTIINSYVLSSLIIDNAVAMAEVTSSMISKYSERHISRNKIKKEILDSAIKKYNQSSKFLFLISGISVD